ncbi:hypothetical protein OF83DRAFT_1180056 [Amylostereum chailletii]|nr:hypothetical protein OF83DRAFT_1180056 [Amylostereum chailletii]
MPCRLFVFNHDIRRCWRPSLIAVTVTLHALVAPNPNALVTLNANRLVTPNVNGLAPRRPQRLAPRRSLRQRPRHSLRPSPPASTASSLPTPTVPSPPVLMASSSPMLTASSSPTLTASLSSTPTTSSPPCQRSRHPHANVLFAVNANARRPHTDALVTNANALVTPNAHGLGGLKTVSGSLGMATRPRISTFNAIVSPPPAVRASPPMYARTFLPVAPCSNPH